MKSALLLFLFYNLCWSQLDDVMYTTYNVGNPCVTLLDKHGSYGCRTPRDGVVGPLHMVENTEQFLQFVKAPPTDSVILAMPAGLIAVNNSLDQLIRANAVRGVILYNDYMEDEPRQPYSPALNMPGEGQVTEGFKWNPAGNGLLMRHNIPFPIWKTGIRESGEIEMWAKVNRDKAGKYPVNGAEITTFMFPEEIDNSYTCLRRGTCLPVGGHSTWTTISPIDTTKEIVMAMASMDTKSMFQLETIGANSDMSGTVALMAVLDAIANHHNVSTWKRQLIFAWFDGESFGNLGSRRLLYDIVNTPCDVQGESPFTTCAQGGYGEFKKVALDKIVSTIELKQVGDPGGKGHFVHQQTHDFTTPTAKAVLDVAKVLSMNVSTASPITPGLPPSCSKGLLSLDTKFASKSVVITDHAAEYANKFFDSIFDAGNNVDTARVCEAATLLYRTLYALGNNIPPSNNPEFEKLTVNCSLVEELLYCLTQNSSCPIMKEMYPRDPQADYPIHYSGVFFSRLTRHQQFMNEWVAYHGAITKRNVTCSDSSNCEANERCLHATCVKSATYIHPASPTNIRYVEGELFEGRWEVIDPNSPEPLWTESTWANFRLRTFQIGDPVQDYVMLGVAGFEVIVTLVGVWIFKKKFETHFRIL